jgi:hypothetical protein
MTVSMLVVHIERNEILTPSQKIYFQSDIPLYRFIFIQLISWWIALK